METLILPTKIAFNSEDRYYQHVCVMSRDNEAFMDNLRKLHVQPRFLGVFKRYRLSLAIHSI